MSKTQISAVIAAAAACACANAEVEPGGIPGIFGDASVSAPDAAPGSPDGGSTPSPDAAVPPQAAHLLLTEIVLSPTEAEMIEIANLSPAAIPLSGVYLADTDRYMWTPAGALGTAVPSSDFVATFPAGASIAPGEILVVAIDGDGFAQTFGFAPNFCLRGSSCPLMIAMDVGSTATLTNSGEPIALFAWDGSADLVTDIDLVRAGPLSATNPMPDKTGVSCDGPDLDDDASSYAFDAVSMTGPSTAPGAGVSFKRLHLEDDAEGSGGNGMHGHDETSEDLDLTWDAAPYSAPTPGSLPASLQP